MLPKNLEAQIKKIIACCTKDENEAIDALQALLTPGDGFILARPNGEAFNLNVDNQAVVGMSDVPLNVDEFLTGEYYGTDPVYATQIEVDLTGTSPVNPSLFNFKKLISADLIYQDAAGAQYSLSSPNAALAAICDGYVFISALGLLNVIWSTTHAAGDTLRIFLRYTRN